jgi:hypothetical protein
MTRHKRLKPSSPPAPLPAQSVLPVSAGARRSHADDIVDGDMYAINHNGQLRVKLVYLKKG